MSLWTEEAIASVTSDSVKELQSKSQRRGGGGGKPAPGGNRAIGAMAAQWAKEKELQEQASTINLGIGMPAAESIPKQALLAAIETGAFAEDGDGELCRLSVCSLRPHPACTVLRRLHVKWPLFLSQITLNASALGEKVAKKGGK